MLLMMAAAVVEVNVLPVSGANVAKAVAMLELVMTTG
jgi:hypothetical protein